MELNHCHWSLIKSVPSLDLCKLTTEFLMLCPRIFSSGLRKNVTHFLQLSSMHWRTERRQKSDEKEAVPFLHSYKQFTDNVLLSQLPVHFLILLFLFPCDPNLHPKFSSQNSANQTFLRLLASVLLRKYLSNPTLKRSERSIKIQYGIKIVIERQYQIFL